MLDSTGSKGKRKTEVKGKGRDSEARERVNKILASNAASPNALEVSPPKQGLVKISMPAPLPTPDRETQTGIPQISHGKLLSLLLPLSKGICNYNATVGTYLEAIYFFISDPAYNGESLLASVV